MPLSAGTKLGRYEIISQIGAGGMGEVYRARDPKINRNVAIKVLPADLSADAERLRRFEQEAQAAGKLNHPNILAIYDVEMQNGSPYVVSELLDGETLRELQGGKGLTVRKAVDSALQLARGLVAAHERGIVHRDLKPENIFITTDGRVKILDFGLAKLIEPTDGPVALANMPTLKMNTGPGAVIGTIGYMSPEQARGTAIDHRTDIFSFGCVLYEMLAGRRAFRGDTPADIIGAILRDDPPELSEINRQVPPGLGRVVRHCLEKAPAGRFQTAGDLAFALELLSVPSGAAAAAPEQAAETVQSSVVSRQKTVVREWIAWALAALLFVAALTFALLYIRRPVKPAEAVSFTVPAPEKLTYGDAFALSPDGRRMAFVLTGETGERTLWVRALDSVTVQQLSGTEGADFPFWSPDGRYLAFFAAGKLKKIEATGGPTQILAEEVGEEPKGGAWGPDGTILLVPTVARYLHKVSASGGPVTPVTELDQSRDQTSHRWPWFLPDGRHFIYFSRSNRQDTQGLYVGSLDSKETKFLFSTKFRGAYVPAADAGAGGYLLFMRDQTLVAQAFDADKLQLSGEPFTVAEDVLSYPTSTGPTGYATFSVSANGHLSYLSGEGVATQLTWFDRAGKNLGPLKVDGTYTEQQLAPDGKTIVATRGDRAESDLWMIDIALGTPSRFTFGPASELSPVWSSDGATVVFASNRTGTHYLYKKSSGMTGSDVLLHETECDAYPDDWSKDGRFILYEQISTETKFDIWVLRLSAERKPEPFVFLQTEFDESHAQFSPDGRFVAYVSNESGRAEVYVRSFPGQERKWQISTAGGDQPRWRRDGRELFYIAADKTLMAVPVSTGAALETGAPAPLFKTRVPLTTISTEKNYYLVTDGGQRFLVSQLEDRKTPPIAVVLNWAANLKR